MEIKYSLGYRIRRRINMFLENIYYSYKKRELDKILHSNNSDKTLYFFVTPTHSNLGDQAQLMCWLRLFKEIYNEYTIICIPNKYAKINTVKYISKVIKPVDLIFIHSGYLIFDPHPELPFICNIVSTIKNHHITILPQTINLCTNDIRKYVANIFNSHPDLLIMCRDEISFSNAKDLFNSCSLKLMPDIVTSLIGNKEFSFEESSRSGVLFCLRNDGEKFYNKNEIDNLIKRFSNIPTDICDTSVNIFVSKWVHYREKIIKSMLKRFSKAQVIITDRYHGTIFSQIVNIPVVVLSSSDHKLSSGVKWFPKNIFANNVYYAKNLDEAYNITTEILSRNGKIYINPPYFKNMYYTRNFNNI